MNYAIIGIQQEHFTLHEVRRASHWQPPQPNNLHTSYSQGVSDGVADNVVFRHCEHVLWE
jgi:hypothetical protein